jgi:hypothetical protein
LKFLNLCLLLIGAFLSVNSLAISDFLIPFIRNSISNDGVISNAGITIIHKFIFFLGILTLCLGFFIFSLSLSPFRELLRNVFLRDKLAAYSGLFAPKTTLISTTIISVVVSVLYYFLFIVRENLIFPYLYDEDGFFENITALFFFISSLIFIASLRTFRKTNNSLFNRKYLSYFLILACLGCFFISMEEISWGQRILGITTPEKIAKGNFQGELNIHNYFNPYLKYLYFVLIPCLLIPTLLSLWINNKNKEFAPTLSLLLPHPSLFLMILIICADMVLLDYGELIEELLSVMSIFYAMRIRNVLLN